MFAHHGLLAVARVLVFPAAIIKPVLLHLMLKTAVTCRASRSCSTG